MTPRDKLIAQSELKHHSCTEEILSFLKGLLFSYNLNFDGPCTLNFKFVLQTQCVKTEIIPNKITRNNKGRKYF
jgi:hypothetical protein